MAPYSFKPANALSAFYDQNTKQVKFTLELLTVGKLDDKTKAVSFFVRMNNEVMEKELNFLELKALITDTKEQTSITYAINVVANAPVDLIYWAIDQGRGINPDEDILPQDPEALIRIYAKPGPLFTPELLNKTIVDGTNTGTLKIMGTLRFALPDDNGGIDLKSLTYFVIAGNVRTSFPNLDITETDIKNKYFTAQLSVNNLVDGTPLLVAYLVDNKGGEQSGLSPSLSQTVTTKPLKCSNFSLESGKIDNSNNVTIPYKVAVDTSAINWTTLHFLLKDAVTGTFFSAASFNRDTIKMDDQMSGNGFVGGDLTQIRTTSSGALADIAAFTKFEFWVAVGSSTFVVGGKSNQSEIVGSQNVVTAMKKYTYTQTLSSTYSGTVPNDIHTFQNVITDFTAASMLGFQANLVKNGTETVASTFVNVASSAQTAIIKFELAAAAVKASDIYTFNVDVKAPLAEEQAVYLPSNTTLSGRKGFLVAKLVSSDVVPVPKARDITTVLQIRGVDDVKSSAAGSKRQLLIDLGLSDPTDKRPYSVKEIEIQVADNQDFASANQFMLNASKGKTLTIPVNATGKQLAESILVAKHATTGTAPNEVTAPVDIDPNALVYIRARAIFKWLGGGSSTVPGDYVVADYKLEAQDSPSAVSALTIKQLNNNNVKVEFNRPESVTWTGAIAKNDTTFNPHGILIRILNELGLEIASRTISLEEYSSVPTGDSPSGKISTIFTIDEKLQDQYVTSDVIVKYKNVTGISVLSDKGFSPELFLARKIKFTSIQTIETFDKIKVFIGLEFGRQNPTSDISLKGVLPHRTSAAGSDIAVADIPYDESEKKFIFEAFKQPDDQKDKYGPLAKFFFFASSVNGNTLVHSFHPK